MNYKLCFVSPELLYSFCLYGKMYEVPVEGRQGLVHAMSLIFENINI